MLERSARFLNAGGFVYIEVPDGTLIEFVETHKIPVMKKLGWYLNLRKRNPKRIVHSDQFITSFSQLTHYESYSSC